MRFSLWYDFRNPAPWRRPYARLYRELLDQIAWVDQLGAFEGIWISEHHFTDDGYMPAVAAMLAAIAERTSNLRIGTQVMLAPLHHPLRIAEDFAVLDQLSEGRVSLGLAAGYLPREFASLGVSKRERGSRTSETIEILQTAWQSVSFSHQGRHFQFQDVIVTPPPYQEPHPPIWVGGSSPAAARRAALYGCHFMSDEGTPPDAIRLFREFLAEVGHGPKRVGTNRMIYVTEDAEDGWEDVKHHLLYAHNRYREWYAEAGEGEEMGPPVVDADELPRGTNLVGTPDFVVNELRRQLEGTGIDSLTFWACPPGLEVTKSARSIELFAHHVAPALADSL